MKGLWKKVSLMAAAVLLFCVMLTGCMSDKYANSEYTGTWKATKASMSGVSLDVNKVIGSFVLELEADGDAKAVIKGEKSSGDWEEVENGFKLKDSQDEMAFTKVKKGVVKTEHSGMVILFEKQGSK
ncbi:hypothetical protein [Megasphaera sp.]|uniref:hypothetical protein n=1 Tax=Megasphaera sp. TaxID=2023260 RepID=UPI0030793C23